MTGWRARNISMNDHQVERLANLLERAVNCIVVTHDHTNQRIDASTYRQRLRAHWDSHWPDLDLNHPRYYTPTLASGELQQQLLTILHRDFEQEVREDNIQTAAIVSVRGCGPCANPAGRPAEGRPCAPARREGRTNRRAAHVRGCDDYTYWNRHRGTGMGRP